jgi:hypothetical protein
LCAGRAAAAAVTDKQIAQRLFDEARALIEHGEVPHACALFAESQRLDPGGGTLLNLALCHEQEGKLAAAYFELDEALSQAVRDGREDRESMARERRVALLPRVPKLTIVPPRTDVAIGSVASRALAVELDGVPLGRAALGVALLLDPGPHRLRATAEGCPPWEYAIVLAEAKDLRIEIPQLRCLESRSGRSFSTASKVAAGVGVGALAGTLIAGGLALVKQATYERDCLVERQFCRTDEGTQAVSAARTYAWLSTASLMVAVVAGVTAWLLPRHVRTALGVVTRGAF